MSVPNTRNVLVFFFFLIAARSLAYSRKVRGLSFFFFHIVITCYV